MMMMVVVMVVAGSVLVIVVAYLEIIKIIIIMIISTDMKIRLYRVYILPVLLYCSETWTTTKELCQCIDSFDCWCLRKILQIPYESM